jgi:anti-anti-sigma factor
MGGAGGGIGERLDQDDLVRVPKTASPVEADRSGLGARLGRELPHQLMPLGRLLRPHLVLGHDEDHDGVSERLGHNDVFIDLTRRGLDSLTALRSTHETAADHGDSKAALPFSTMEPVFVLCGEIDMGSRDTDRDAFETFLASADGPMWVVDLTAVSFMDSSGLGLLVAVNRAAKSRGVSVLLRGPTLAIRRLLTITGLSSLFDIEAPTVADESQPDQD